MVRLLTPLIRNATNLGKLTAVRASSTAPAHHHHKTDIELAHENHATLNDLPIPAGPWQEYYDRRQAKWNMLLGVALVVFAASTTVYVKDTIFFWFPLSSIKKTKIDPTHP
jgi:hypothetical protein